MSDEKADLVALDALFELARESVAEPSGALLQRIQADADQVQSKNATPQAVAQDAAPRRAGPLRSLIDAIGGWPSVAGMVSAALTGIWIGWVPGEDLPGVSEAYAVLGIETEWVDVSPGFGALLMEDES